MMKITVTLESGEVLTLQGKLLYADASKGMLTSMGTGPMPEVRWFDSPMLRVEQTVSIN